jgi:hypothetical protein
MELENIMSREVSQVLKERQKSGIFSPMWKIVQIQIKALSHIDTHTYKNVHTQHISKSGAVRGD